MAVSRGAGYWFPPLVDVALGNPYGSGVGDAGGGNDVVGLAVASIVARVVSPISALVAVSAGGRSSQLASSTKVRVRKTNALNDHPGTWRKLSVIIFTVTTIFWER